MCRKPHIYNMLFLHTFKLMEASLNGQNGLIVLAIVALGANPALELAQTHHQALMVLIARMQLRKHKYVRMRSPAPVRDGIYDILAHKHYL